MTKRTAEKTLVDELAKATVEESRAQAAYERAREKLADAEANAETAWRLVLSAGGRISRVATALEALAPKTLADTPAEEPDSDGPATRYSGFPLDLPAGARDREETIAAATGTDVETVRKASGRSKP